MSELLHRRMILNLHAVVTVALCLLASLCCRQPATQAETKNVAASGALIRLDAIPMMDPVATFVSLQGARAEAFRYSRPRLAVVQARLGTAQGPRLRRISRLLQSPGLHAALRRRSFSGEGLSSGDQFHLAVVPQGECFGFTEEAPAEVQSLIRELLQLAPGLGETPLAAAYVRSEPIDPQRAEGLRRRLDFRPLEEAPSDLRPPLTRAVGSPRSFISLEPSQLAWFLKWGQQNRQIYASTGRNNYELTLYTGENQLRSQ
jgi:hypothetical protein